MKPTILSWRILILTVFSLGATQTTFSQPAPSTREKPVALIHGILVDGSTWNYLAPQLRSNLHITTTAPTLGQSDALQVQAGRIENLLFVPGTASMPFVAHSQGGPVSRAYSRLNGSRINGLVTIGSPHRGAFIAETGLNGWVFDALDWTVTQAKDPLDWHDLHDPEFGVLVPFSDLAVDALDYLIFGLKIPLVSNLCSRLAVCKPIVSDAMYDHRPTSLFHQFLNSTSTVEAAKLSAGRVSIVGTIPSFNAAFRLFGVQAYAAWVKNLLFVTYQDLFFYYALHENIYFTQQAYHLWEASFHVLLGMDLDWLFAIGDPLLNGHDGFMTAESQQMVGTNFVLDAFNMAHTEETTFGGPLITQGLLSLNAGIEVREPTHVSRVYISPDIAFVSAGNTRQVSATAQNYAFVNLPGKPFTWVSHTPSVASVSQSGVVTGLSPGTAYIEAISEGYGAIATLTIVPPTLTGVAISSPPVVYSYQPATFTGTPSGGLTPFTFTWSVDNVVKQSGPSTSFTWSAASSYTVSVTLTDASAAQVSASKYVDVQSCGQQIC